MSYTYLQEQGEESLVECFSDIPAYVRSRLNLTAGKSYFNGNGMESSRDFPFGMMSGRSTDEIGKVELTLWQGDFPAKTLAQQAQLKPDLTALEAVFGASSQECYAKYDPNTHSLKTRQTLLLEAGLESLQTLSEWGMTLRGECFPLAPLVHHTCDAECSYWPTPRAGSRDNCGGSNAPKKALRTGVYVGGKQNPNLSEWLMGWPIGMTDLQPLEMGKFQRWLSSHGKLCLGYHEVAHV